MAEKAEMLEVLVRFQGSPIGEIMKIEDISKDERKEYSYSNIPLDTPFVYVDNAIDSSSFYVKKPKGLLLYSEEKIWPSILDHSYFSASRRFCICTPKRVTTEWKGS